jgi:hypothetical protein
MFCNKISKEKERLIYLAVNKDGKIKFKSLFLYNTPYMYSSNEDLRYYLWMQELRIFIFDKFGLYSPIESLDMEELEKSLLNLVVSKGIY